VVPAAGRTGVSARTNVSAYFSEAMKATTVNGSTCTLLRNGATTPVSATISYDAVNKRAILDPSGDLRPGATYFATVKGGSTGVKDLAGHALARNKTWAFTVAS
jgi:Bacterial Ig-like domain